MPRLHTVKQFRSKNRAFTEGGLRGQIFNAKPRIASNGDTIPGNGLKEAGAIVWIGRRVYIDEDRYFDWVDAQQD